MQTIILLVISAVAAWEYKYISAWNSSTIVIIAMLYKLSHSVSWLLAISITCYNFVLLKCVSVYISAWGFHFLIHPCMLLFRLWRPGAVLDSRRQNGLHHDSKPYRRFSWHGCSLALGTNNSILNSFRNSISMCNSLWDFSYLLKKC